MQVTDTITDEVRYEIIRRINEARRIVIAGHVAPDDDSIASAISVAYFITEKLGHKGEVRIRYPGSRMTRWDPFEMYETVTFTDDLGADLEDADLAIFVDGNQWHRYGIERIDIPTVCIDHHHYESLDFDFNVIDPTAASTTELIEQLFYQGSMLDEEIAPILLMGIIGDTGQFRFVTPKNAQVLITAHRLITTAGIDVQDFLAGYHRRSFAAHPVYAALISRATVIEIDGWPRGMYSYATEEECAGIEDDDISEAAHGFVSYLLQLASVKWGFVATPRSDGTVKMSFRSLPGTVNVKDVATLMGIGGGHDLAAGASMRDATAEEACARTLAWCRTNEMPADDPDARNS